MDDYSGRVTENDKKILFVIKPHIFNAIVPHLARNLIYAFLLNVCIFGAVYIAQVLDIIRNIIDFSSWLLYPLFFITALLLAFIPLIWKVVIFLNTQYFFYIDRIVKEFEFFIIRRQSVSYDKIVDVTIDMSVWDRLCRSGDITLHTVENRA
ncbi:MAG: PH domain-containing protein, partial [Candidatus Micrarchaeota archaeon]|nr:PH domain-containing protein [Candidatus Micrarchaeota archaeon]